MTRRLLLVHAHPDDETIGTGATMAKYAAEGARVTLVTCTRGEQGEIVAGDLAHHASGAQDTLGEHRIDELAAACAALGVPDHRFLGGAGRWRDSGMMGTSANSRPDAFWNADLAAATGEVVAVIRQVRPQVVVTYDERGGYGHPDHIRAHDVTMRAVDAAADPARHAAAGEPWQVAKVYYTAVPRSVLQAGIDYFREHGGGTGFFDPAVASAEELPFGVPDELVTTRIDGREYHAAKVAALRAHRSQIAVNGVFFALADGVGRLAFGVEHFRLVRGKPGPGGPDGLESDLFAGLD